MPDLIFEDPPEAPVTGHKGKWLEIGKALRARPGEWALVHVGSRSVPNQIKKGNYALGPGKFEAVSRTVDGEVRTYARYIGGDSDA